MLTFRSLLLGCVVLIASAAGGFAQTQNLIGSHYESYTGEISCFSFYSCSPSFPVTPAGKIIQVDEVVCSHISQLEPTTASFGVTATAHSSVFIKKVAFEVVRDSFITPFFYKSFRSTTKILIGAGRFPTAYFLLSAATDTKVDCVLTGTVVQG